MPPSPMQWLPEGHLAYFVLDLVRELDVSAIDNVRRKGNDDARPSAAADDTAQDARRRMHQKVTSPEGRRIYARRKVLAEPVFGQIKEGRGFRRFSLRGLAKAGAEWAIVCLCHNLLKLYRAVPRLARA